MNTKNINKLVIVVGLYIAFQMLSDIMSLRIVYLLGMSIDGGTLIYPLTFTIRDVLHKLSNKRVAQQVIMLSAIINVLMILCFWIIAKLPPDLTIGEQLEFGQVLLPFWRIVVASIIAEVVSELIDSELYEKWVTKFGERKQWGRVLSSNLVSIPVDSAIFVMIAFYGMLPLTVVVSIFIANVLIKFLFSTFAMPMIYVTKS